MFVNRSNRKRAGVFKRQNAWISLENGFATRACTLLEKSETRARLWLEDTRFAERTFLLKLSLPSQGQRCEVEWRDGHELGVRILPDTRKPY